VNARERYKELVALANEAAEAERAKTLGKVAVERRARIVVELNEIEAVQLLRLSQHLGRSPAELVNETVRHLLFAAEGS
jgi:hypothetical protein